MPKLAFKQLCFKHKVSVGSTFCYPTLKEFCCFFLREVGQVIQAPLFGSGISSVILGDQEKVRSCLCDYPPLLCAALQTEDGRRTV